MVGIVVVSHSELVANGAKEIALQMAPEAKIEAAGGTADNRLGTDINKITEAIKKVYSEDGVMIFVKKIGKDRVSIVGVSCSGAVFHNIGQLVVASAIVQNIDVMLYLPILSIAGIGTGIFIGVTANFVVKHLSKLPYFQNLNLDL